MQNCFVSLVQRGLKRKNLLPGGGGGGGGGEQIISI